MPGTHVDFASELEVPERLSVCPRTCAFWRHGALLWERGLPVLVIRRQTRLRRFADEAAIEHVDLTSPTPTSGSRSAALRRHERAGAAARGVVALIADYIISVQTKWRPTARGRSLIRFTLGTSTRHVRSRLPFGEGSLIPLPVVWGLGVRLGD